MSKISKTAAASMRGGPTEAKKDPFDTNEKKIKELRVQRQNKLAVIRYDFIDSLIEEFDKVQLLLAQEIANVVMAHAAIEALLKRVESNEAEVKNPLPGEAGTVSGPDSRYAEQA